MSGESTISGRERVPHPHHTERPGADRNGTRDDQAMLAMIRRT
jgi:hypothetical protein